MTERVLAVIGTRPEAIKQAPVVKALEAEGFTPVVCVTGQHRDLVRPILEFFGIKTGVEFEVMREKQDLWGLTNRLMTSFGELFAKDAYIWTLVQGDTTSALCGALASFYARVPVGHVEAGLRTGDIDNPFPEEMNRTVVDHLAGLCFAPTERAREYLLREGIPEGRAHVTGNTVIDALLWTRQKVRNKRPDIEDLDWNALEGRRVVLLTTHRRESIGKPMRNILKAARRLAAEREDIAVVFPVHPNPEVRSAVEDILSGAERVYLIEPVDYPAFVALMDSAYLIMTDSGGILEEAPSLDKPVLVLRDKTERPEILDSGGAVLVGTDTENIMASASGLLDDDGLYSRMAAVSSPFGDGQAARRIAETLAHRL